MLLNFQKAVFLQTGFRIRSVKLRSIENAATKQTEIPIARQVCVKNCSVAVWQEKVTLSQVLLPDRKTHSDTNSESFKILK